MTMKLTLDIPNEQLFNQIVWFLKRFKNDGLEMSIENKQNMISSKPKLDTFESSPSLDAFGILNGRIPNPEQWQRDIRSESDSNIYENLSK